MRWNGAGEVRAAPRAIFLALISIGVPASAQEIRVLSEEIRQFTSPMVLETSLDGLLDRPSGEKWIIDKTRLYSCRGLTIESLEFVAPPGFKAPRRVDVRAVLNNNSGKDKKVTIRFEAMDGEAIICSSTMQSNVEQGKTDHHRGLILLTPPERWTLLPRPRLRIVLTVADY